MKRFPVALFTASLLTVGTVPFTLNFSADASESSKTATTHLHIEGMTCAGCETAVKLVLRKTPGVLSSSVSYAEKRAVVSYDPARTTPTKLASAIAEALSYQVTVQGDALKAATSEHSSSSSCATPAARPAGKPVKLAAYRTNELRAEFNKSIDQVRVVALLSPTCGACQDGQRVVESVFSKHEKEPRLRGFVVWLPMLQSDDAGAASLQAGSFIDPRIAQTWDPDRNSGKLLATTLGLKREAWDVYLLYAPGVKWTGAAPPSPTFWMHQLRPESGADQKICLNPAVFLTKVAGLLRDARGRRT